MPPDLVGRWSGGEGSQTGYTLMFGCVSGPDFGAMGLHFVNMNLVGDPSLDPRRPEIVIYEPTPGGYVNAADLTAGEADQFRRLLERVTRTAERETLLETQRETLGPDDDC